MPTETKPLEKLCKDCGIWKSLIDSQGTCPASLDSHSLYFPSNRAVLVTSATTVCKYPVSYCPKETLSKSRLSLYETTRNSMSVHNFMQSLLLASRAR